MTPTCWDTLGIDPVEDKAAIRKAYARRLKDIDPEAEPQAFLALRAALDDALNWLRWRDYQAKVERLMPADIGNSQTPNVHPIYDPPMPVADSPQPGDANTAQHELEQLLFNGDTDPDPATLRAVVDRILTDPAMTRIDHAEKVRSWLANVIAGSTPRSDPVVATVVEHFGMANEATRWDRGYSVDFIVARHAGLALLEEIADPNHRWHAAYRDLMSDDQTLSWTEFVKNRTVRDLLRYIRDHAPAAESGFAPHRVALWNEKLEDADPAYHPTPVANRREVPHSWLFIILGLILLGTVTRCSTRPDNLSKYGMASDPDAALLEMGAAEGWPSGERQL